MALKSNYISSQFIYSRPPTSIAIVRIVGYSENGTISAHLAYLMKHRTYLPTYLSCMALYDEAERKVLVVLHARSNVEYLVSASCLHSNRAFLQELAACMARWWWFKPKAY